MLVFMIEKAMQWRGMIENGKLGMKTYTPKKHDYVYNTWTLQLGWCMVQAKLDIYIHLQTASTVCN